MSHTTSICGGAEPSRTGGVPTIGARRLVVLIVDDNDADVDLAREALAESPLGTELHAVSDGVQALAFLRRAGAHAGAPCPDLILLDLNMPRLDGRGVLTEVKQDPALQHIPIVVLSSSAAPDDVAAAYGLRANCYVTKPTELDGYLTTIRAIERFWVAIATSPPQAA